MTTQRRMPREEIGGEAIPVFTTYRVDAVVNGTAWLPQPGDRAISAPEAFASVIWVTGNGTQHTIPLEANVARGLEGIVSVTFGADGYIEVM